MLLYILFVGLHSLYDPFELFHIYDSSFFYRDYHEPSLVNNILSIMTHILSEDASLPLVDVVLHNVVKEEKVSLID